MHWMLVRKLVEAAAAYLQDYEIKRPGKSASFPVWIEDYSIFVSAVAYATGYERMCERWLSLQLSHAPVASDLWE